MQLESHDKQWDEAAIQTIKNLKSILGDDAVDIQHIGSTAIPAIKAKPIIDIAVGVTDFEKIMLYNEQLQKDGIFYRGSDVENQILYVMGDMEKDIRTHHIHIVKWNGTEWKNYIHFRDYLNDNENMALQYQKVKEAGKSGYIWHTTGSGKTMTSYKATRNLLMDIPSIQKTVFLIDRKDLDLQTKGAFQSYADNDTIDVDDTEHVGSLIKKLADDNRQMIVTTRQKMQVIF